MKKLKAFTLIELLIVIMIVGILSVSLLPNILNAPSKAKDARTLSFLYKVNDALILGDASGSFTLPSGAPLFKICLNAEDFQLGTEMFNQPGAIQGNFSCTDESGGPVELTWEYQYTYFPGSNWSDPIFENYALIGVLNNVENANTSCNNFLTALFTQTPLSDQMGVTTTDDDACYVILN